MNDEIKEGKERKERNGDSEKPLKHKENILKVLFPMAYYLAKFSFSIGTKLWGFKKHLLLSLVISILSVLNSNIGSNDRKSHYLVPNDEIVQLHRTLRTLPMLHQEFISKNQQQLEALDSQLLVLKKERERKDELFVKFYAEWSFLPEKLTQLSSDLETNTKEFLLQKKENAELKKILARKENSLMEVEKKIQNAELTNQKSRMESEKEEWQLKEIIKQLQSTINKLENGVKEGENQLKMFEKKLEDQAEKLTRKTAELAKTEILLDQLQKEAIEKNLQIESFTQQLESKKQEIATYNAEFTDLKRQLVELTGKLDDNERKGLIERLLFALDRIVIPIVKKTL